MKPLDILEENYDVVFHGHFGVGKKIRVGPSHPTTCRFCKRSAPEVTFKQQAHAIPELLGNRQLLITNECDDCNGFFARAEDHLGKFLKPFRTMGMVRGKTGFPVYVTSDGSRVIPGTGNNFELHHPRNSSLLAHDPQKKEIRLNLKTERYIPCAVYKALVKIALSVMPEAELGHFTDAMLWITKRSHEHELMRPLIVYVTFAPGFAPYRKTSIIVLRKRPREANQKLPACQLVLSFGNVQLQLFVPSRLDAQGTEEHQSMDFESPIFPTPPSFGKVSFFEWDLTSNEVSEPYLHPLKFTYQSVEEFTGNQTNENA